MNRPTDGGACGHRFLSSSELVAAAAVQRLLRRNEGLLESLKSPYESLGAEGLGLGADGAGSSA